jgi:hypothetical protein
MWPAGRQVEHAVLWRRSVCIESNCPLLYGDVQFVLRATVHCSVATFSLYWEQLSTALWRRSVCIESNCPLLYGDVQFVLRATVHCSMGTFSLYWEQLSTALWRRSVCIESNCPLLYGDVQFVLRATVHYSVASANSHSLVPPTRSICIESSVREVTAKILLRG